MIETIQLNSKRKYISAVMYPNCRICRLKPLTTEDERIFGVCEDCNGKAVKLGDVKRVKRNHRTRVMRAA